jgi:hypothetical protein
MGPGGLIKSLKAVVILSEEKYRSYQCGHQNGVQASLAFVAGF